MKDSTAVAARPIAPELVNAMRERNERVVFVDARNPDAWRQADTKLPGAIRIPADDVYRHLSEIPSQAKVITYCT